MVYSNFQEPLHATTVLAVRHNHQLVIGADGQATLGQCIAKSHVKKVRSLLNGQVLAGFAGSTSDAFTLLERFEEKLKQYPTDLKRAAIELAKAWRTDRMLRKLEAMLLVANLETLLVVSGTGDVLEPDLPLAAIGSGALYAQSAAAALLQHAPHLTARKMVESSLTIAADYCIYTNHHFVFEEMQKSSS